MTAVEGPAKAPGPTATDCLPEVTHDEALERFVRQATEPPPAQPEPRPRPRREPFGYD